MGVYMMSASRSLSDSAAAGQGRLRMKPILFAPLTALLVVASVSRAEPRPPADLVLVNGKVWTVNSAQPQAEAVAVWRDRILAVGKSDDIKSLAGSKTRIIDLKGRRVVP